MRKFLLLLPEQKKQNTQQDDAGMVKLLLWYSITLLHPKYSVEAILLLWVEMLLRLKTWASFHSGRMGPPTSWKPITAFRNSIP
jgi:hypothetical protein